MSFVNIFFQYVTCLLSLLTLSFAEQNFWILVILIKYSLSILSFMDHASGGVPKKSSPYPRSSRLSLCYLLGLIVLCFTFRSVIYFELIFVKDVRSVPRFNILHVDVQLFQHHLLKRLSLFHYILLHLWKKSFEHICVGFFPCSLFCSIGLCLSLCQCHTVFITVVI